MTLQFRIPESAEVMMPRISFSYHNLLSVSLGVLAMALIATPVQFDSGDLVPSKSIAFAKDGGGGGGGNAFVKGGGGGGSAGGNRGGNGGGDGGGKDDGPGGGKGGGPKP